MRHQLLLLFVLLAASVQAQDSLIIETIRANTTLLDFNNGQIEGAGAELLKKELANHQFILIGEMHGIAEVGDFSEGLFNAGKNNGFKYFAVETDPWIAAKLEEIAQQGTDKLVAFSAQFPLTIPFYDNAADFPFLESVVKENGVKGPKIWGLDQAFMTTSRFYFYTLKEAAKSDATKTLAEGHYKNAVESFGLAMQNQDPSGVYMTKVQPQALEEIQSAFLQENNQDAASMISALHESKTIYNHWFEGRYHQNNRVRSIWMKARFMDYYKTAQANGDKEPKVMFKFGSNHAVRGLTSVHIYDLGNMVSELAESIGNTSLHINFTAIKGESYNMLMGAQAFDYLEDLDGNIKEAIRDHLDGDQWIMIDTRPLRNLRLKNASEAFKRKVFGFDILVYAPKATALESHQ